MNKQEAINHLNERRKFFLNKQLFGRAETMAELIEIVKEKDENYNFDHIKTAGIYVEILNPLYNTFKNESSN